MIKRLIGLSAAAATIAVVIFALLGYGSYRSMLFTDDAAAGSAAAPSAAQSGSGSAAESPDADVSGEEPAGADSLAAVAPPEAQSGLQSGSQPVAASSEGSLPASHETALPEAAAGPDSQAAAATGDSPAPQVR